jgi:predicted metal-binding membrane protein
MSTAAGDVGSARVDPAAPPHSTFSLLSRRVTAGVVAWLLALSGLAWLATVRQATSMSEMASGLGQVGARMPSDMTAPLFLLMWVGMMVAMMLPAVAPMVLAHRRVVLHRGEGGSPTVAFVVGYLVVWSVAGLVPLACFLAFRELTAEAAQSRWLPTLAGLIIVGAGAYQFTGWKAVCLRWCRTPIGFVMTHDFGAGGRGAFRAGFAHGGFCLGCCWALMTVLVVVGFMNLVWMAALSLIFLVEKNWSRGVGLTRVVGTAMVVLGLAVVLSPDVLPDVSGAGADVGPTDGATMGMAR